MNSRSGRESFTAVCLLVTSLFATPTLATWYVNQSEGYYKPQEYHNERFGDFPPADIDQKLFGHLTTTDKDEENSSQTDNASLSSPSDQQVLIPTQNYNTQQNTRQPAYGSYNKERKYTSPGLERHIRKRNEYLSKRNARLSSPRYNRGSSFSGPWNNNGSSFSGPWNNNGSNVSGPWNNRGSSFNGPWDNNGSSFNMPWGNNNGSNFSPFGKGSGWSW